MQLLNATKMKAGYTAGLRPDGRELLVVVVKGTFKFPVGNGTPELAAEQADLVMADEFTGEPGLSTTKYECDFAPFKPRCDVLLNGSAYAPGGRPVTRVTVSMRVGKFIKTFNVVGNRSWTRVGFLTIPGSPEPLTVMPISYDNAFGGADLTHSNPSQHQTFPRNHVGKGFHKNLAREAIDGKPLPNTEDAHQPVTNPSHEYTPMAFGPIGRAWEPRPSYGGTYDKNWLDNVFPFLPSDFDERYYQAAPQDQQVDYLRGGEEVVLVNLTPQGRTTFRVPSITVPVTFYLRTGEEKESLAASDTIIVEPDLRRFIMVWRISLPLQKSMFEVAQVVVGTMSRSWHRARASGKTWYRSLKELTDERRQERAVTEESSKGQK